MRPSLKVVMYFHPYPSQMRQTLSHPYSASPTRHSGYFLVSFRRNGAMRLNALISQSCFSLWSSYGSTHSLHTVTAMPVFVMSFTSSAMVFFSFFARRSPHPLRLSSRCTASTASG